MGDSFTLYFLLFIFLPYLSYPRLYGDADSMRIFSLPRYALNTRTTLSIIGENRSTHALCSFAQLGFPGAVAFKYYLRVLTALLMYRIAKKLDLENPLLIILFTIRSHLHGTMMTGLTEILFGLGPCCRDLFLS